MSAGDALPRARAAADRALEIVPSLAEAHTSSAFLYENSWQWDEAENELARAVELNPNYATAHQWLAGLYVTRGKLDDAMAEYKRAQELDPLSPVIGPNVGLLFLLKNDYRSAVDECRKSLELNPNVSAAHWCIGWGYFKQQLNREALAEFEKAVQTSKSGNYDLSSLGYFYAATGRTTDALKLARELEQRYADGKASGIHIAGIYIGLGDKATTFSWLEKDLQRHDGSLPGIVADQRFDPIRTDPRYRELVKQIGLP
jgi:tetratricopeptide (TPR) repeat protein